LLGNSPNQSDNTAVQRSHSKPITIFGGGKISSTYL